MVQAIKQRVRIERDGVVEIHDAGLLAGDEAEVIVLLDTEFETDEEMASLVRAYDEAKAEQNTSAEAPIPFDQAVAEIEAKDMGGTGA
jgi:hypothetical protein